MKPPARQEHETMAGMGLTAETRDAFVGRIQGIRNTDQRQWGRLTPAGVLAHLDLMLRLSLGESAIRPIRIPLLGTAFYVLFFQVFTTWPKGTFKAPAKFFPHAGDNGEEDLEAQRAACLENLDRFVEALSQNPDARAPHPFMGNVSLRRWARIHGVHFDHHLRQFSV